MKFSTKLTLLLSAFILLSIGIASYLSYTLEANNLQIQVEDRFKEEAFNILDKIDRTLFERVEDIRIMATEPSLISRASDPRRVTKRLKEFRDSYKLYSSISFFTMDRIRIADTDGADLGKRHTLTRYWPDIISKGKDFTMTVSRSESTGKIAIFFASVVKDVDGNPVGVIVSRMPIEELQFIVEQAAGFIGNEKRLTNIEIIERDGLVIYSSYDPDALLRKSRHWDSLKNISFKKIKGGLIRQGKDGMDVIAQEQGFKDFSGNGWILTLHVPADIASLPVMELRKIFLVVSLITVFFGFLASLFFSRTISKPLMKLRDASIEIAKGNLDVRVEVPPGKEISELAESFNKMIIELKERTGNLLRANELLKQEIAEREHAEEEKKKIQVQMLQDQKIKAIGELAGGIAHDFNNLIILIKVNSTLALKETSDENMINHLRQISETADRAAGLTRQLLIFSRSQPVKFDPLNINDTLQDMLKILNRLIPENISVKTDVDPDIWTVRGDRGTIEQLIMNLVINARDAMPRGGCIYIRTDNTVLGEKECKSIPGARPGRFVSLTVEDTGTGMEKEVIAHIFDPFFTTKGRKGTGLGLAVVKSVVTVHNGWINVLSTPGQGSTFRIYLPAMAEEVKNEEAENLQGGPAGKGERILLVEDEKWLCKSVAHVLHKNGYTVLEAEGAKEAVSIFDRENGDIDLVFSDLILKDKNGMELIDELESKKPGLRVLLTSGYIDIESQLPKLHERGFYFLQKSYEIPDLLKNIRKALEKHKEKIN